MGRSASVLGILDETAEARRPGEEALHRSASQHQGEAAFGLRKFYDLSFDGVLVHGPGRGLPGIALIAVGLSA